MALEIQEKQRLPSSHNALLRKAEGRNREASLEAMGRALDAVTPSDARAFWDNRGYRPLA